LHVRVRPCVRVAQRSHYVIVVTCERVPLCWQELPVVLEKTRRNIRRNFDNPDDSQPDMVPVFHFEDAINFAKPQISPITQNLCNLRNLWFLKQ